MHHKPVDEKTSAYTIEELEQWKIAQSQSGSGAELQDEEAEVLGQKLDELIDLLSAVTTLNLSCDVRVAVELGGGLTLFPPGATDIKVGSNQEALPSFSHIGIVVRNDGSLSCEISTAGFEFDVGVAEMYPTWMLPNTFTQTPLPHALASHSSGSWFHYAQSINLSQHEMFKMGGSVALIGRFRAYCRTGSDLKFFSPWYSSLLIPGLFKTGTSQSELDDLVAERDKKRGRP